MTEYENMDYIIHRLNAQIAILKDVEKDYPTSSINNIIMQQTGRLNFLKEKLDSYTLRHLCVCVKYNSSFKQLEKL